MKYNVVDRKEWGLFEGMNINKFISDIVERKK